MWDQMTGFFTSAFYFAGTNWLLILLAIGIGLVFGALWLIFYRPPIFKYSWFWLVAIISAVLTWSAIAFVQIPLQYWTGEVLAHFWSINTLNQWMLIAAVPQILLSGIVQEAAKLAPVYFYWVHKKRSFTPQFGLLAGAISGAGFGIFEAIWVNNQILASGWNLAAVQANGFAALWGFWERLFAVCFHIAAAALTGYGLAKHKGWQFYLVAALLHGISNYTIILLSTNHLTVAQDEISTAIFAVCLTAFVLYLRWHKAKEKVNEDTAPAVITNAPSELPPAS